jgi:hypothetical protein
MSKIFLRQIAFDIGDVVYLRTDKEQDRGLVCAVVCYPKETKYFATFNGNGREFFDLELSTEKNYSGEINNEEKNNPQATHEA